jgi:hypothetical protein
MKKAKSPASGKKRSRTSRNITAGTTSGKRFKNEAYRARTETKAYAESDARSIKELTC